MKISWGLKLTLAYSSFVALILFMVISSSHQHFDLVSKDYYDAEIGYQKVIDAGKNQAQLSSPMLVHANSTSVIVELPEEFRNKALVGKVEFYSPVNAEWDRSYPIVVQENTISISRNALMNTRYKVKINCAVDSKNYYQETEIFLHS
jgi:hypothetical protein